MDIDQQMVFNRLPLNDEQRKKLYEALNAERQTVRCLAENSATQSSPVQSDSFHLEKSLPISKTP